MFMAQLLGWILITDIAIHFVKKQTNEMYQKAMNVLIQSYDTSMEMVYSMLNVMAVDENIVRNAGETGDVWQNEITRRALLSYKLQHSFVEDIFVYYRDSSQVISSNTVAAPWIFYHAYGDVSMSYGEWQDAMKQTYFRQDVSWESSEGRPNLWILHTLPVFSGSGSRITVAVKFNEYYVQSLVDNFSVDNSIAVVITNGLGRIVAESGNMSTIKPKRNITGRSARSGWTYTAYMSWEAVRDYESGLPLILLACLGIEILIFVFASFFFVKTNYNPFTELIEYINRQNPDGIVSSSEYVYIRDSFEEIVRKRKKDEEEFINKLNRLKIAHLLQIITGNIPVEKVDRHVMEEMQLNFIFGPCVVLLVAGNIENYIWEQKDCLSVFQSYGIGMDKSSALYGCSFVYGDMAVCIFRLDEEPEEIRNKLVLLWTKAGERFAGEFVIAASSLRRSDNQLGKAYEEAQFVMQSAGHLAVKGLLLYDELRESMRESMRDNKEEYTVHMVQEYITAHYAEEDLTVDRLCRDIGKSVSYTSRLFKEKTGQSILYYINMVRTEEAKRLLKGEDGISIDEIGRRVGFAGSNSFIRIFKKYEQVTPGKYREMSLLVPQEVRK